MFQKSKMLLVIFMISLLHPVVVVGSSSVQDVCIKAETPNSCTRLLTNDPRSSSNDLPILAQIAIDATIQNVSAAYNKLQTLFKQNKDPALKPSLERCIGLYGSAKVDIIQATEKLKAKDYEWFSSMATAMDHGAKVLRGPTSDNQEEQKELISLMGYSPHCQLVLRWNPMDSYMVSELRLTHVNGLTTHVLTVTRRQKDPRVGQRMPHVRGRVERSHIGQSRRTKRINKSHGLLPSLPIGFEVEPYGFLQKDCESTLQIAKPSLPSPIAVESQFVEDYADVMEVISALLIEQNPPSSSSSGSIFIGESVKIMLISVVAQMFIACVGSTVLLI